MSSHAPRPPASLGTRVMQAVLAAAVFALLFAATRIMPAPSAALDTLAAVGFLLLSGTLFSDLLETVGIPHLTGYLLAGILAGPHVAHLLDEETVKLLDPVNALALALIAFAGGAELRLDLLRRGLRSLLWATFFQCGLGFVACAMVFVAASPLLPFTRSLPLFTIVGIGLLWGVVGATRSPSATLAIISQTRASGPLASFTLAFIMSSDVVILVLLSGTLSAVRPLLEPGASFAMNDFRDLGHELLGSVSMGTTLGLLLVAYLRFVGRHLLLVFVALGFGFTAALHYLRLEPLLTFLVAGFVVQNLSSFGERFLEAIEDLGSAVYVIFFASAGAHLDVPLLRTLWPIALLFCGARAVATYLGNAAAMAVAGERPALRRWGWAGLVSQAGVALGVAALIERKYPTFGGPFRALAVATVAVNEVVGPVLFKLALDRNGESSRTAERERPVEMEIDVP